jgi:[ribosomal protein S18]-alanine N-acetyltransferase
MTIDFSILQLRPMQNTDLDEVMAIEQVAHTHPWSRGNFIDALAQHDDAWVLCSAEQKLFGYFVQTPMVEETHLLTIAVQAAMQGQGIGRFLLQHAINQARLMQMSAVSLEVRVSNTRALALYEAFGFRLVGRRKDYYQASPNQREDALILHYAIA